MALAAEVDSLDEIAEPLREHYVQDATTKKYRLDAPDLVPKKRLDDFRENKKSVDKQLSDLKERYKDIDPDAYKTLKEKLGDADPTEIQRELAEARARLVELEGASTKTKQETKAELEQRLSDLSKANKKALDEAKAEHAKLIEAKDGTITQQNKALSKALIDNQIVNLAIENGVRDDKAMFDVKLRAANVFSLEDGKVVAHKENGDKWLSDATDQYLTVTEWYKHLAKEAPHLFKESTGTGATGNATAIARTGNQTNGGKINPWKPTADRPRGNATLQSQLMRDDRPLAVRMYREVFGRDPKWPT
jgi:hypothetical protein